MLSFVVVKVVHTDQTHALPGRIFSPVCGKKGKSEYVHISTVENLFVKYRRIYYIHAWLELSVPKSALRAFPVPNAMSLILTGIPSNKQKMLIQNQNEHEGWLMSTLHPFMHSWEESRLEHGRLQPLADRRGVHKVVGFPTGWQKYQRAPPLGF